jgi:hypothetical protein
MICVLLEELIVSQLVKFSAFYGVAQLVYGLGFGQDDRGSIPGSGNDGNFSLRCHVQTGSGAHPASYPVGTWGFLPGGKVAGPRG